MNRYKDIIEKVTTDMTDNYKQASNIVNECFEKIAYLSSNGDGTLDYELTYDTIPDDVMQAIEEGDEYWENPRTQLRMEHLNKEINSYLNNHKDKKNILNDMNFNNERKSISHKHSGKVGTGIFAAGTAAPYIASKMLKKPGLKSLTPTAGLISALAGGATSLKMDEKVRTKHYGPAKMDNINKMYDEIDRYMNNEDTINRAFNNADNEYRSLKRSSDKYSRMSGGHNE